MEFETRKEGDYLIVQPSCDRIDADLSIDFKEGMISYLQGGDRKMILDLARIEFIDSSGLGAVVSVLKALGRDGRMVVCNTSDPVMSMFQLTRMDKVFEIHPTLDDALLAVTGGRSGHDVEQGNPAGH
jgi:anti-sigma B factor antagonist